MSLSGSGVKVITRTSKQLFRDCLRLIQHISGKSRKSQQLRRIVGGEFRRYAAEEDPVKIDNLKSNAIRALANYLMIESTTRDEKLRAKTEAFIKREASDMNDDKKP